MHILGHSLKVVTPEGDLILLHQFFVSLHRMSGSQKIGIRHLVKLKHISILMPKLAILTPIPRSPFSVPSFPERSNRYYQTDF